MTEDDAILGERNQHNEDTTMSIHYAKGVFRRLAEERGDCRKQELNDYVNQPTIEEIVEDMVEHGYEEAEARRSAQQLFDEEIYDTPT